MQNYVDYVFCIKPPGKRPLGGRSKRYLIRPGRKRECVSGETERKKEREREGQRERERERGV